MNLGSTGEVPVEDHEQKTEWSCGPAALKIVLDALGHTVSEDQLIKLTGATPEAGTRHEGMVAAAEALGYKVHQSEETPDEDLAKFLASDIPVVIDYQGSNGGHYVVLKAIENGRVRMQDPRRHGARDHTLDINLFNARWHSTTYGDQKFTNRWMMVVLK
jgi:predicted double-glycine peptidase